MGSRHILVVEDEPDILELLSHRLQREGYKVTGVSDGETAVTRVRAQPPDLVLLDLMLPGLDGLEVCRSLKQDPRTAGIPIVMLTAKGEIEDVIEVRDFFRNPYVLEVSSPGLDRPLKKERDFLRALGKKVSIRMSAPLEGRRHFQGELRSFEDGILCLSIGRETFLLPYGGVEKARLVYEFEA